MYNLFTKNINNIKVLKNSFFNVYYPIYYEIYKCEFELTKIPFDSMYYIKQYSQKIIFKNLYLVDRHTLDTFKNFTLSLSEKDFSNYYEDIKTNYTYLATKLGYPSLKFYKLKFFLKDLCIFEFANILYVIVLIPIILLFLAIFLTCYKFFLPFFQYILQFM